ADIVEHFRARPVDRERLAVGAVGQVVAAQPVVGGRKAEPGFAVARPRLDGAAEMLLGETVVALAVVALAEREIVALIAAEDRVLDGGGIGRGLGLADAAGGFAT